MSIRDHHVLPAGQQLVTREEFEKKMAEVDSALGWIRSWRQLRSLLWSILVAGLSGLGIVMLMVLAELHLGR